jgi:hypothetical protein
MPTVQILLKFDTVHYTLLTYEYCAFYSTNFVFCCNYNRLDEFFQLQELQFRIPQPLIDWLIYFTFRQIFTDMEAVIVIHRSTRNCADHLSQHNLQTEKNLNIN